MAERIQKILARAGYGSRRHIEEWIRGGRIHINKRVAELGDTATEQDRIFLDGKLLEVEFNEPTRVLLYHKPSGEVCSRSDPEGRPTVFENLPRLRVGKWLNIGRLDFNTAGLLLFTNDGELAHKLMHPSSEIEREYAVRIYGEVDETILQKLRRGVQLEDGMGHFDEIVEKEAQGKNRWFHVLVKEGRNRLVRRLWESQGFTVSRLIRIRFGTIILERDLRPHKPRELKGRELEQLFHLVDFIPKHPDKQVERKSMRLSRWNSRHKKKR